MSEETFTRVALEDPDGQWELHCGRLRQKPGMTAEHNDLMFFLGFELQRQLSRTDYRIRVNAGHIRRSETRYYIPDVLVLPAAVERAQRGWPPHLETYPEPQPLVVEVWSQSTGTYDVEEKLTEYQRRGDLEIWRIHPYERTLIAWRRQPDGTYTESLYTSGAVQPVSLPGVSPELATLFAE